MINTIRSLLFQPISLILICSITGAFIGLKYGPDENAAGFALGGFLGAVAGTALLAVANR